MAVLKYRHNGAIKECCAYGFKWLKLNEIDVISGDKYYISLAVAGGAKKPPAKAKKKEQ
ncbi:hypothetical protein NVP1189B_07 [Vibrio phage 1.189.B._10N.286.51.B5]|nr:hypothetical protein NVP1189B_07 [Vibrio phage 1.189.B._10N.286.51.B5]AUR93899.1 hypothetical protein NVP1189C_07 [Vibrio phage 1.189.C._10N.286.51.B5]AUR93965.1 hypothetical protein NVP1189O_07 [Vibrio phage 1.189.O._10N.286.51.B5]